MADQRKDPRNESIVDSIHSRSGATILPPKGNARMLIREFRNGRTIGFVIDNWGERGTNLSSRIFGLPTPTNSTPALIALKGNVIMVPVYTAKTRNIFTFHFDNSLDA